MGALLKRLDDLRFDFDLSEDAFASGTLRDLGWLLPRNAALCVVDALRVILGSAAFARRGRGVG